ncbi:MAG: M23 family metallopeptidase [Bdellovibrionales bacterium]|nr:M23 family metallopeptidase [Bdellovibrionales bacterium]
MSTQKFLNQYLESQRLLKTTPSIFKTFPPHPFTKHSLHWPVDLSLRNNRLGNLLAQFQSYYYGYPYFHGGVDIISQAGEPVFATVDGKIEAGFYNYVASGNGYFEKKFIPYGEHKGKEEARDQYFEIAIIHKSGYRFEFHHIDPNKIPNDILIKIKSGGSIKVGEIIGYVIPFHSKTLGENYDHIHYNIISPSGIKMNPEWFSQLISDRVSPKISALWVMDTQGQLTPVHEGFQLSFNPTEFIVESFDQKDDLFYFHQPHKITLLFESGQKTEWNFSYALADENFMPPNIFDYFVPFISINHQKIYTEGDYDHFRFFNRLQIPPGASGPFSIIIEDAHGNTAKFSATILP